MKEYVRMYLYDTGLKPDEQYLQEKYESYINLVSEVFTSFEDAEIFSLNFSNNYSADTVIRETPTPGEYIVFAKSVRTRFVNACYNPENMHFVFANWKFDKERI